MKRALVMTGLTTMLIAIGLTASAYALIRHASPGGDRRWRDTAAGLHRSTRSAAWYRPQPAIRRHRMTAWTTRPLSPCEY